MAIKTITHSEISAVTASKMGNGTTAETVDKTVTEYGKSVLELISEHLPKAKNDELLVETPLAGYRLRYHENGVKKNADGTETKVGTNYTFNSAVPNYLIKGVNSEALKIIENTVKGVGKILNTVKKSA